MKFIHNFPAILWILIFTSSLNPAWAKDSPLIEAVKRNDLKKVKELIEADPSDINVVDTSVAKRAPLHLAVELGHESILDYLLEKKADPNVLNERGNTALIRALFNNRPSMALKLIHAGTDLRIANKWGSNALNWAARNGHTEILEKLIKMGSPINNVNSWGSTALHWAARNKDATDIEALKYLALAGANTEIVNDAGKTALLYAKENGRKDFSGFLEEYKRQLDATALPAVDPLCTNILASPATADAAKKLEEIVAAVVAKLAGKSPPSPPLGALKSKIDHLPADKADKNLFVSLELSGAEEKLAKAKLLNGFTDYANFERKLHLSLMITNPAGGRGTKATEAFLSEMGKALDDYLNDPKNKLTGHIFKTGTVETFPPGPHGIPGVSHIILRPDPASEVKLKELQEKIFEETKKKFSTPDSRFLAEISEFSTPENFKPHITLYRHNSTTSPLGAEESRAKIEKNLTSWKGGGGAGPAFTLDSVSIKAPAPLKDFESEHLPEPTLTRSVHGSIFTSLKPASLSTDSVSAREGVVLDDAKVKLVMAEILSKGDPKQFPFTQELVGDPKFRPFLKRKFGGPSPKPYTEFYISRIIQDSNSRLKAIMYVKDDKGVYFPRVMYKSQSDGGWRSCPGYEHSIYSKGHGFHYTQETKPIDGLIDSLEQVEAHKDGGPVKFEDGDLITKKFNYFSLQALGINDYEKNVTKHDDEGVLAQFQKQMPGYGLPADAENVFANYDFNGPGMKEFVPNFKMLTKKYIYKHTLLGETTVRVFRGKLNGRVVEWHMATNHQNKVWIDRINFADAKINTYGVYSEVINSGALTNKPLEYTSQMGAYTGYEPVPGTSYGDITKLLGNLQPIKDFKAAQKIGEPDPVTFFQKRQDTFPFHLAA